jgi:hypothetical protein
MELSLARIEQTFEAMARIEQTIETIEKRTLLVVDALMDMNSVEIISSQSDRAEHHKIFEEQIANNYRCKHDADPNLMRCVVTNHYHPKRYMSQAAHILAVENFRNSFYRCMELEKRIVSASRD